MALPRNLHTGFALAAAPRLPGCRSRDPRGAAQTPSPSWLRWVLGLKTGRAAEKRT